MPTPQSPSNQPPRQRVIKDEGPSLRDIKPTPGGRPIGTGPTNDDAASILAAKVATSASGHHTHASPTATPDAADKAVPRCPLCNTAMRTPDPTTVPVRGIGRKIVTFLGLFVVLIGLMALLASFGGRSTWKDWLFPSIVTIIGLSLLFFGRAKSVFVRTPGLFCPSCRFAVGTL